MTINKTTTDLSTLKINYLTQEMYEDALENEEINENELYITPGSGGGTSNTLLYGICDTAANTAAKTATIDSSFELVEGATIAIKFTNTNTIVNPTLNINNTGAKAIKNYGTTNAGVRPYTSWSEGEVVPLLYDGTYWQIMYNMAQNNSVLQTHSTSNSNYNLALSSYTTSSTGTNDINHSTKIKGNPSTGRITTEDMTSQEVDDFVDSLNITTIRAVDYVVEQGTNGSWTYRKWDSGIAECWGTAESGTYTNTNAWGSGKYMNIGAISFPSGLFVAKPNLIASIEKPSGAGMPFLSIFNVSASGFSGYIYDNNTDSTGYAYNIYAHAIGRWK